ncbi:hypothetical protein HA402_012725 [Bradysia odoriphaga]|nr:hypothetical protein HA402_012725 [Bradysia odoriphaga]
MESASDLRDDGYGYIRDSSDEVENGWDEVFQQWCEMTEEEENTQSFYIGKYDRDYHYDSFNESDDENFRSAQHNTSPMDWCLDCNLYDIMLAGVYRFMTPREVIQQHADKKGSQIVEASGSFGPRVVKK